MTRCADVVTVIGSLTTAQQKVLERYKRNLSHDRDPMVWDDAMEKALLRYAKHPAQVQRAIHDLKKRGFTQTRYEYKQIADQMQRFTLPQNLIARGCEHSLKQKQTLLTYSRRRSSVR